MDKITTNFKNNIHSILLYWSIPAILCLLEKIIFYGNYPWEFKIIESITMNVINLTLMYIIYIITNFFLPNKINAIFYNIVWGIIYTVNYYVNQFRGSCIVYGDLKSIKTALNVSNNYNYTLSFKILILWIILIILNYFIIKVINSKYILFNKLKNFLIILIIFMIESYVLIANFTSIHLNPNDTTNTFYKGYISTFCISFMQELQKKPVNYNEENAKAILEKYTNNIKDKTTNQEKPNVIIIMNESFSDLSVVGDVKNDKDYMPYIHELQKSDNTITGYTNTSVLGGGTYLSENEVLTGESAYYSMGYDDVNQPVESLASIFKEQGYNTYASHPYDKNGYRRNIAYPYLGFDNIWFLEDTEHTSPDYMTDKEYYDLLIKDYEKNKETDKPLFYFGVTMQNHSPYNKYAGGLNKKITSKYNNEFLDIYLSDIYASDQAFKYLCEYFKDKENTIIVMFGDHQPVQTVVNDINKNQEIEERYKTPFVIWANYDIEEEHNIETSCIYLGNKVLKLLNIPLTPFRSVIDALEKEYPIFAYSIYDKNNNPIEEKDTIVYSSDIQIINDYHTTAYYLKHHNITPE